MIRHARCSSSPLRISLAGGGTDVPSYYRKYGGSVLGTTMHQRVTAILGPCKHLSINIEDEQAATKDTLQNPFLRAILHRFAPDLNASLTVRSELPSGLGLGSSAAFCLAIIGTLVEPTTSPLIAAELASKIEISVLGRPVGKQDQYLSALGSIHRLHFTRHGNVGVEEISVDPAVLDRLNNELLVFSTRQRHDAGVVLRGQSNAIELQDQRVVSRLHQISELTDLIQQHLMNGELESMGALMGQHWNLKRELSPQITNELIDAAYASAIDAGATGGRLLGAGGGGCLLLHVPMKSRTSVTSQLCSLGLFPVPTQYGGEGWRIHTSDQQTS